MSSEPQNGAPRAYRDAIEALARQQHDADSTIREIWSYDDPAGEVVRIVEVSDYELLPAENGEVFAVRFKSSPDFPYVSELALITPHDWDRLRRGDLRLPAGWSNAAPRRVKG